MKGNNSPKKKLDPRKADRPTIRDFENAIPHSKFDQQRAIAYLVTCRDLISVEDQAVLRDLLPMEKPNSVLELDLKDMMQEQMMAARALRNTYFLPDGSLRPTSDIKEARESLRAAQQIMDSILKKQSEIDMYSKLREMEKSLFAAVAELPSEAQKVYYTRMKRILGDDYE